MRLHDSGGVAEAALSRFPFASPSARGKVLFMGIVVRRERKACKGCGYERAVEVRCSDATLPGGEPWESYDGYCQVCVLRGRVRTQEKNLRNNQERVAELLRKRAAGEETE